MKEHKGWIEVGMIVGSIVVATVTMGPVGLVGLRSRLVPHAPLRGIAGTRRLDLREVAVAAVGGGKRRGAAYGARWLLLGHPTAIL